MFKFIGWGLGDGMSVFMEGVVQYHDYVMGFMVFIFWFVVVLVCLELRGGSGSSWGVGGLVVEAIWTVLPVVVLVFMAYPSLVLLYINEVKGSIGGMVGVEAHQWYWVYVVGVEDSSSYLLSNGQFRMLDTDNRLVVAAGSSVVAMVSSVDVVHSWAVPMLGLKLDCVPGRLNQVCFNVMMPGVYYGQCSELCGILHSFMPIVVEAVI
nr:cytochrome c oxidase subunit 2 [Pseudoacanthocephalus sp.]